MKFSIVTLFTYAGLLSSMVIANPVVGIDRRQLDAVATDVDQLTAKVQALTAQIS
jgi:hypothetical protein